MTPEEELQRFHEHCRQEVTKTLVATIMECLAADPYATSTLLTKRGVECNHALALHPFVPVRVIGSETEPGYILDVMSLLNSVVAKLTGCYLVTSYVPDTTAEGLAYDRITKIELISRDTLGF